MHLSKSNLNISLNTETYRIQLSFAVIASKIKTFFKKIFHHVKDKMPSLVSIYETLEREAT
jgi:hypothetical protein